jgi:hypothetical protein
MASSLAQAEHHASQSKKAAASGWIGSALEYYDFFINATAASLIFPQIFFPSENPTVAIVNRLRHTAWVMWPGQSAHSFSDIGAIPTAAGLQTRSQRREVKSSKPCR